MKKTIFLAALGLLGVMVSMAVAQDTYYGEKINDKGAISVEQLVKNMAGKEEMQAKIEGVVLEVCQVKGCWMTIEKGDGTKMRVTFKDYGFFVPKDISGKKVVMAGVARTTTTSVDELR